MESSGVAAASAAFAGQVLYLPWKWCSYCYHLLASRCAIGGKPGPLTIAMHRTHRRGAVWVWLVWVLFVPAPQAALCSLPLCRFRHQIVEPCYLTTMAEEVQTAKPWDMQQKP